MRKLYTGDRMRPVVVRDDVQRAFVCRFYGSGGFIGQSLDGEYHVMTAGRTVAIFPAANYALEQTLQGAELYINPANAQTAALDRRTSQVPTNAELNQRFARFWGTR